MARYKIKKISRYMLVLLLITAISSELMVLANSALAPLSPVIEVLPKRVSIHENVTLKVEIMVNEPSNVTASKPVISGTGDATLQFENASITLDPGQIGTLEWIYDASKSGSINFGLTLTVKKLSDESIVLTQSLNSAEIGIAIMSEIFLMGVIILTLYVFLTSKFDWFKPKGSYFELFGGWFGIIYTIISFFFGLYFATLSYHYLRLDPEISIIILGSFLALFGLGCCMTHKIFHDKVRYLSRFPNVKVTELTGLSIILFGLSGFFVNWQIWNGLVLIMALGIMAMGKEFIEMKTE